MQSSLGLLLALLVCLSQIAALSLTDCQPLKGTRSAACKKKIPYCNNVHGIGLKWAGRGCLKPKKVVIQDSGCQCLEYCGYVCASTCNRDPRCEWRAPGVCYNKAHNKTQAEINMSGLCGVTRAITSRPTKPAPSESPTPAPTMPFKIQVTYWPNPDIIDESIKKMFQIARDKWSRLLVKGFPTSVEIKSGAYCQDIDLADVKFTQDRVVEDLLVAVKVINIDGENGVWARSGVCIQDTSGRPRLGVIILDASDIAVLKLDRVLQSTITHEMGHCLGLGTLWEQRKLVESEKDARGRPKTPDPRGWRYIGKEGKQGHFEVTGYRVPARVENLYGGGTARKHWKDAVYPGELMTGFIESDDDKLSKLTARGLRDLGYAVDITKADPYIRPNGRREGPASSTATIHEDVVDFPLVQLEELPKSYIGAAGQDDGDDDYDSFTDASSSSSLRGSQKLDEDESTR